MQVGQPSLAAAAAPLDADHYEVERMRALELQPAGAATAGLIRRAERLGHQSLVTLRSGVGVEPLGVRRFGSNEGRRDQARREDLAQDIVPLAGAAIDQRLSAQPEAIEEEHRKRQLAAHGVDVELAAEAPHRDLERVRPAVSTQCDRLSV